MIELQDDPAVMAYAQALEGNSVEAAVDATRTQLDKIETAQQQVLSSITSLGSNIQVLYQTKNTYNGIALQLGSARDVDKIQSLPGVKSVSLLPTYQLDNSSSVPLIGAPEVWNSATGSGATGQGIRVGVIDTGIDYLHVDFGGDPQYYSANDPTVIDDLPQGQFPGVKVVGGYDFAGDNYDGDGVNGSVVPTPDPDPTDCYGHGTHVAGTLAGYGVTTDGQTYTGGYDSVDYSTLKIGPGVAPEASLYSLKVFGCNGSTSLVTEAIDWAMDPDNNGDFSDHLDVINMSLGSPYGSLDDPASIASNNAARAGMIVVAAAGNEGDTYYVAGSPATASRAISAASSVDMRSYLDAFSIDAPDTIAGIYPATIDTQFGPNLTKISDVSGSVILADPADGCGPLQNQDLIAGNIALIDRGTCAFVDKVQNAQDAGAIAVLVANNAPGDPVAMGGTSDTITIPSIMTDQDTGTLIKTTLATDPVQVTLSGSYQGALVFNDDSIVDTLSTFSSRGPARVSNILKPDITAPGDTILSAASGTGTGAVSFSGTSMATPHTAGTMALLKQIHPDWSVEELKALLMNTANHDLFSEPGQTGDMYGPGRVGSGRIDAQLASTSDVVMFGEADRGAVSVSFGAIDVNGTYSDTKVVRVENKSDTDHTYSVSFDSRVEIPGVEYAITDKSGNPVSEVSVAAHSSARLWVQLTADASQMAHTRDATVADSQDGVLSRQWVSEAAGYLVLSEADSPTLRLSIYADLRPTGNMHTTVSSIDLYKPDQLVDITLDGTPVQSADEVSAVSAFQLEGKSPKIRDSGQPFSTHAADIQYLGASTDRPAQATMQDSEVFFALSSYFPWNTPNEAEFDVNIDVNHDGVTDYILYNSDFGTATGGSPTDAMITVLVNVGTGEAFAEDYVDSYPPELLNMEPYNNNVIVLPVFAADLGLSDTNASFDYYVTSYHIDSMSNALGFYPPTDVSDMYTFDAANLAVDTSAGAPGLPIWQDNPTSTIAAQFNVTDLDNLPAGVLLLHHQNSALSRNHAWTASSTAWTTQNTADAIPVVSHIPDLRFVREYYDITSVSLDSFDLSVAFGDYSDLSDDVLADFMLQLDVPSGLSLDGVELDLYNVGAHNDEQPIGTFTLQGSSGPYLVWGSDFSSTVFRQPINKLSNQSMQLRVRFNPTVDLSSGDVNMSAWVAGAAASDFDTQDNWVVSSVMATGTASAEAAPVTPTP